MLISFTGEKNDDPNHPDFVPSQFSFIASPVKAKVKRDLTRYHRSQEIKAKRLKFAASSTISATDGPDIGCTIVDEEDHNDSTICLLESQQRDESCEVGGAGELEGTSKDVTQHLQSSTDEIATESRSSQVDIAQDDIVQSSTDEIATESRASQVDIDHLEEQHTDVSIGDESVKDTVPVLLPRTEYKQTDDKNVQVDSTHLEFNEHSLQKDDKKVNFYTGLPNFATLYLVFELLTSGLEPNRGVLTAFQEICMVMIKLRLNLEEKDLAYRFGISQPSVSRIFRKWIAIMAERLRPLIYWPDRAELRETMPIAFRKFFPKCVCILDCTEVFIERPSDLKARAQTWSNYKQHNTVKILIAVTPQGSISFVSKAWGGRASDKYITEQSGILDKLLPGDLVLADRGFTIQDSVGFYCAEVKTPPFTKGKKQLSRHEVDWSREISHVRIHVERVIGLLKQKYTIMQGTIPISLLKDGTECTIDNIITTCSALCNLCVSVVPSD